MGRVRLETSERFEARTHLNRAAEKSQCSFDVRRAVWEQEADDQTAALGRSERADPPTGASAGRAAEKFRIQSGPWRLRATKVVTALHRGRAADRDPNNFAEKLARRSSRTDLGATAMSSASRRRTRTRVRSRSVTRPHVEGLEARFAAGTVIDLFGSSGAGLGVLGQPGEIRPSKVVTADSAAGQRHAVTLQSRSPVTSLLSAPTAPKRPDGRRSSSAAVSPISSQENAIVLDPRWDGTQGPAEAAWDRMGTPDTPQRGAIPTGPLAPRAGSAASGAAGNRFGNPGSGTLTAGSGGSAAGGGGASAGGERCGR